jgi:hypothetical protein
MKKILLVGILACAISQTLVAQDRAGQGPTRQDKVAARNLRREEPPTIPTPSLTTATPEMWFYEQERARHENPKVALRRKAELRSMQRQQRIAAMKWYGMSNSRPTVNPTPLFGAYSPTWVSYGADPFHWHTGASAIYVVAQPRSTY